jgi:hypothetical protein
MIGCVHACIEVQVWQEWCLKLRDRKSRRKEKHREKERDCREGRRERSRPDSRERDRARDSHDTGEPPRNHKKRRSEAPSEERHERERDRERERGAERERSWEVEERKAVPAKRQRGPDSEGGTPRSVRRGDVEAHEGGHHSIGKTGSFDVEDGEV